MDSKRETNKLNRLLASQAAGPARHLVADIGQSDSSVLLLQDAKGNIKGYAVLDDTPEHALKIDTLYVRQQGQGRGSRMLKDIHTIAKDTKKDVVVLEADDGTEGFYERNGFERGWQGGEMVKYLNRPPARVGSPSSSTGSQSSTSSGRARPHADRRVSRQF